MAAISVEFQPPRDGGIWCAIATGEARLEISASYVPYDSISDLAAALALVLKGGPEAVVSWNEEPAEYEFRFQGRGGEVRLDVLRHAGHGRTVRGGHRGLAVEGGRLRPAQQQRAGSDEAIEGEAGGAAAGADVRGQRGGPGYPFAIA
jgi:hypothetical protein